MNYDNTAKYTQAKNYLYGRSAAQRMTGLEVKQTRVYNKSVLVIFEKGQGARPRFISKDDFKRHFAEYRKQGAASVFVSYKPFSGNFRAPSSYSMQESYSIDLFPDHLKCTCADWKTQEELGFKTPMCKHSYAVLFYIGCQDLQDYIKRCGIEFLDHQKPVGEVEDELYLEQYERDLSYRYEYYNLCD